MASAKQINKMITTYRKNDKKAFQRIIDIAEMSGIATRQAQSYYNKGALPNNPKWISESKKNKKKVEQFYKRITAEFGTSYTKYEKYKKGAYKRYLKNIEKHNSYGENILQPLSYTQFGDLRGTMSNLVSELYEIAYELEKNGVIDNDDIAELSETIHMDIDFGNESEGLIELQNLLDYYENQAKKYNLDLDKKGDFK